MNQSIKKNKILNPNNVCVYVNYNKINMFIIMERNQVISVAVGVGALGTALAYLAYSHINKEEDELINNLVDNQENKDKKSWVKNLWNGNSEEIKKENIKLETTKDISCWGQFWKNEYNKQQNDDDNAPHVDDNKKE